MTAVLSSAALITAGCGTSSDTESTPQSPAASQPSQMPAQQAPADRLMIDVTIEAGEVTPTNERLQARVDEPIIIRVNSDAADELHVHSNPEHTFAIEPRAGQIFQFTVDVPGTVEIELHELQRTIATVAVQ
ncbi:hypothetical protein [Mycolicibacterium sp. XJ1819]